VNGNVNGNGQLKDPNGMARQVLPALIYWPKKAIHKTTTASKPYKNTEVSFGLLF